MDITTIGNYQIVEEIGKGGFGRVFLAVDKYHNDLQVAVKIFERERLEQSGGLAALESECIQLDALDHPNIVRFKHLIVEEKFVGVVLEYLQGKNLRTIIKRDGELPLENLDTC